MPSGAGLSASAASKAFWMSSGPVPTGIALYDQPSAAAPAAVPAETTEVTGWGVTSLTISLPVGGFFVSAVVNAIEDGLPATLARYALAAATPESPPLDAVVAADEPAALELSLALLVPLLEHADRASPATATEASSVAVLARPMRIPSEGCDARFRTRAMT